MTGPVLAPDRGRLPLVDMGADVWVSASAGTGKTHALTDRVASALLDGADPREIVAITYTRTAAAEIAERVADRAASWAGATAAELDRSLVAMGLAPDEALRARARGLARLLADVPEGLAVGTIHGFAQGLVSAFPLEAGMAPGARVLDDRETDMVRAEAFVAALAAADDDEAFARDVALLSRDRPPALLEAMMGQMMAAADTLTALGPAGALVEPALRRVVGVRATADTDQLLGDALAQLDLGLAARLAAVLPRQGTPMPGQRFAAWQARDHAGRLATLDDLVCVGLTGKGEPRALGRWLVKSGLADSQADHVVEACLVVADVRRQLDWLAQAGARLRFAARMATAYAQAKQDRGAIDYGDMIARAARLLASEQGLSWVAWRLDRRFRHVLLDEAQDTSPEAWAIVDRLGPDRLAEPDARGSRFTVGDFKQAIYGFQGSDPALFAARHAGFRALAPGRRHDVTLARNRRSAPVVLKLVDTVLDAAGPAALGLDRPAPPHEAHRAGAAGSVTLLPLVMPAAPQAGDEEAGEAEDEGDEAIAVETELARRLAQAASRWLRPGPERLAVGDGTARRWARPGDLLFLVQARGSLMPALVAALHGEGVEVAGADRLRLMAPLAIQDMAALMRFVVQPADDLALATLLVSPLFGWEHEAVRRLRVDDAPGARPAPAGHLWRRLREAGGDEARWLADRLASADIEGPFAFVHRVLADPRGRRAFRARMGVEPEEALDALLDEAQRFEAVRPSSLTGFVHWLERGADELKRDAEGAGDRARILTVHAAKGLQAPIVVLADAARLLRRRDALMLELVPGRPPVPLPCASATLPQALRPAFAAQKAGDEEEWQRLLYVAMTRAADHLVVAGALGTQRAKARIQGKDVATGWHGQVEAALRRLGAGPRAAPGFEQPLLALVHEGARPGAAATPAPPPALAPPPPPPPPPPLLAAQRRAPAPERGPAPPSAAPARRRGIALHRVAERLAIGALPPQHAAVRLFLEAEGLGDEAVALAESMVAMALAPAWARLFSGGARAEAPFVAHVDGWQIRGTFDLLLVEAGAVQVVDLKTTAHVPGGADAVHPGVLDQMARYARAAGQLFPGRELAVGLLYTSAPRLIALDTAALLARPLASPRADA